MKIQDIAKNRSTDMIDQLDWDLTPEQIKSTSEDLKRKVSTKINEINLIPDIERTFNNTVLDFESVYADFSDQRNILEFPFYTATEKLVRDASAEAKKSLSKFANEVKMNVGLYKAIKSVGEKYHSFSKEQKWLIDRILRDFKRNGLDLSNEKLERLKSIRNEIDELGIQFSQSLFNYSETLEFTSDELENVPENTLKILKKDQQGNYIVGLSYPEVIPILEYAKNPNTRKKVKQLFSNRCADENPSRLERAIQLRAEASNLLGYPNHASYVHEIRMVKSPENATDFLSDLELKLKTSGENELEALTQLKKEFESNSGVVKIHHYDWRFYRRLFTENTYQIDNSVIKQYFPTEHVISKMLDFYQEVLGLIFVPIEVSAWHQDVKVFTVVDSDSKELVGRFYLDLYPREGKYNHAAAFTLIKGRVLENGTYQAPASAMVANFTKPIPDNPSLLSHSDVVTLFHEFGHICHQVLTTATYARFSGTAVSRDFVETPSQLLENWVWEPSILRDISSHYQTGDPLPEKIIQNMIKAKNAISSLHWLRQIFFAKYDLIAHTSKAINSKDLWHKLHKDIFMIKPIEGTNGAGSFGHILGGAYDASYYGYLWAKVYAQDLYTKFKDNPKSKTVGREFRKKILEPGGSMDEMDLIKNFLDREPNNQAFFDWLLN